MTDKPAFPHQIQHRATRIENWDGMTMRQYYKASVVQGLLASGDDFFLCQTPKSIADTASSIADAMLAEDEQSEEPNP